MIGLGPLHVAAPSDYLGISMENNRAIRKRSKGQRLKWTPLRDVEPVRITLRPGEGRRIAREELERRRKPVAPKVPLLVP